MNDRSDTEVVPKHLSREGDTRSHLAVLTLTAFAARNSSSFSNSLRSHLPGPSPARRYPVGSRVHDPTSVMAQFSVNLCEGAPIRVDLRSPDTFGTTSPFPFTDLTAAKLRPALVLHEGDRGVILAFISSKTHAGMGPAGVMVSTSHAGFLKSGFKVDSVIRLDKIATVLKDLMVGELGELDDDLRAEVNAKLAALFRI